MNKFKTVKKSVETLSKELERLKFHTNRAIETISSIEPIMADIQSALKDAMPPTRRQIYKNEEIEEIKGIIEPGFSFVPTKEIESFLKDRSEKFKGMNTMQIGILLGKCGFRPGNRSGSRGFFVDSV
jgi:hypothetical protein